MSASTTESWLDRFRKNWNDNAERSMANSLMDSGWSGAEADRCRDRAAMLSRDILVLLAEETLEPRDFFDRPRLCELVEAAKIVVG